MSDAPYVVASVDLGATSSRIFLREQRPGGLVSPDFIYQAKRDTTRSEGPHGYVCEDIGPATEELLGRVHDEVEPGVRKRVGVFSFSTHGAANTVCLDERGKPVFGTVSYDHPLTDADAEAFYAACGNPSRLYVETGTPDFPNALNWAKLLFHQKKHHPREWAGVRSVVPFNVYAGLKICASGTNPASDHTQTRCHGYGESSDGSFSSVIRCTGIQGLFPPFKSSYEVLGRIDPDVAEKYGFGKDAVVVVGGHDSSLFVKLLDLLGFENGVGVSSGTWDVIMALRREFYLEPRLQEKGVLQNAGVDGEQVRTALFRGGQMRDRYIQRYREQGFGDIPNDVPFDSKVLHGVMAGNPAIEPAYMDGFGPYPNDNKPRNIPECYRGKPAAFHHALAMSLALQRAMACEIAAKTKLPDVMTMDEFRSTPRPSPIVVGGHLAENYREGDRDTGRITTSMATFRIAARGDIYRFNFPEPTSLATHIMGVCGREGIKPDDIGSGRMGFDADRVTLARSCPALKGYAFRFEKALGLHPDLD